jgi:hypothetical protein
VVLPNRIYGLDVTLCVGERHLDQGTALAQITRDLNARGVPVDQRHTGRIFRDYLALASLERGGDKVLREQLCAQGGIVLMCDGVQFDGRSPVLYVAWDAVSGTPLFGERKAYRGQDDLVPLLKRVRAMDVPVIGVVTDKETGLVPAVQEVFPEAPHQYCHTHFLRNCAKPLQEDLQALQASVRRRADAVRQIARTAGRHSAPEVQQQALAPTAGTATCAGAQAEETPLDGVLVTPGPNSFTEEDFVREVAELVQANSRVSGKAPLDPAELARHERLMEIQRLVREAREKKTRVPVVAPPGR